MMKFSTVLIFTTQILSVLGGKKKEEKNPIKTAHDVCSGTQIGAGVSAALCGVGALAAIVTVGVASPALVACGAAASVIGGASAACKEMAKHKIEFDRGKEVHDIQKNMNISGVKKDLERNDTHGIRKNNNNESEICFDILMDGLGERCINTRDLVEIGTRMDGSVNCPLIGETKCVKDELFMVCGSDKKWKLDQMCPNGMTCKKVSKKDKSIVCAFNEKSSFYERKFDVGYPSRRMEETAGQLFT
jgi:hypothetical protein